MTRIQNVTLPSGFNPKHDIPAAKNPVFRPFWPLASLKRDTISGKRSFWGETCHVFDVWPLERRIWPGCLQIFGLLAVWSVTFARVNPTPTRFPPSHRHSHPHLTCTHTHLPSFGQRHCIFPHLQPRPHHTKPTNTSTPPNPTPR